VWSCPSAVKRKSLLPDFRRHLLAAYRRASSTPNRSSRCKRPALTWKSASGKSRTSYQVYITFHHEQEFGPGTLDPGFLPWMPSASPGEDGQRLFDRLFADDRLKTAGAEVRGSNPQRRVRLRIDAAAPELHTLPRELLRDAAGGDPPQDLAAATATPFSRYLAGRWQPGSPIQNRRITPVLSFPPTKRIPLDRGRGVN
jgi:hypothetical protein